jgi:hypothetical protein
MWNSFLSTVNTENVLNSKKVKLSLQQTVEAHSIVRGRGSHIF